MELNAITEMIIHDAVRLHSRLGPGLLESVYERLLEQALLRRGLTVQRQKSISVIIDGLEFANAFRVDLIVDEAVIVEVKCVEKIAMIHQKQVLTYLRLLDYRVGLLLNFGAPLMRDGIRRLVNGFTEERRGVPGGGPSGAGRPSP